MDNPLSKYFIAALFIYILTVSAVWADRILIDDPEQTVSVSNNFSCYRPVDITVDTRKPDLYESDSRPLQKLADSVRAMLSYECPELSSIQLTGLISGLEDVVYQATMSRNNNWLVQPVSVEDSAGYESNQSSSSTSNKTATAKRYDDELIEGRLEVTGLNLGMSVDEVRQIVIKTFAVEPDYDLQKGILTMNADNCSADYISAQSQNEIHTDLICLTAWFSDHRIARLQRLNLIQVVDGQSHQVSKVMIKKYGNPTESKTSQADNETLLAWRAIAEQENQSVIQELEALITDNNDNQVTSNVMLFSTQPLTGNDNEFADLDLKL